MSIDIRIQSKAEQILQHEAAFYGVTPTAVAKAIMDKVVAGDLIRDVLQGVDVASYQDRRPKSHPKPPSAPKHPRQFKYSFKGAPVKLEAIAAEHGVSPTTLRRRINSGMPIEQALSVGDMRKKGARV
ncbi:hypothetical protein EPK99_06560 [Neorhizobium lilium]|uniref:Uncharacterized protein n=1 Tax=Neorhizobium lilium TaxID=2503024 RepID=A0A444LHB7_9HYPH|nr:hypothetical protein [Neorhizobium lilium]RWX78287.1 hypothetical protein EPK99_06560 [Neorhizobium lilium]